MYQPAATTAAAGIAAIVTMISLFVTVRTNRKLAHYATFTEELRETRVKLKRLAKLTGRVDTSVRRLVSLAPSLSAEHMMEETTHTLAIVSDLFRATGPEEAVDFPKEVTDAASGMRKLLTKFFLVLDLAEDRRADAQLARMSLALSDSVAQLHQTIREHILPKDLQ